ncbi:MAG: phosphoenolpyruvate carboxylase [Candidatus Diapherotrites archaeon]|uniref:Phosphoenolpyruvate carboxylase n=1 Tax=Candidatus Iainarchaeum sp. TaxID=3101447 RepID=A0A8T4L9R6_9ARCH|nr:phosphoenolpyruvate carboxylase [Candidatus Diapherotrites archaeon]
MHRKIPATMATQHPDNANAPYWKKGSAFINSADELRECYLNFDDLGCQEYMWDWEGKYVDEGIVDKLLKEYYDFFRRKPLGKERFLTLRIPRMDDRRNYPRIARAFMTLMTAEDLAAELGMKHMPVFEIILPFTREARTLVKLQKKFALATKFKKQVFTSSKAPGGDIQTIPLIEDVNNLVGSRKILEQYVRLHKKAFGRKPAHIRPFIARSDPALNAGMIPATIAAKAALSQYRGFAAESGVGIYPIIGTGSNPFRGNLRPNNLGRFMKEYAGVRTVTVQSAFRYDYPRGMVRNAVKKLNEGLRKGKAMAFDKQDVKNVRELNQVFARHYFETVLQIAPDINAVSRFVPPRRERLTHTERFGYGRKIGRHLMPRVIPFCAALYSLGVPPELIGTGRGLLEAEKRGLLDWLEEKYLFLAQDLREAGSYLNRENLESLAGRGRGWRKIIEDVEGIEGTLALNLGPAKTEHFLHRNLTGNILLKWGAGKPLTEEIEETARIRQVLG